MLDALDRFVSSPAPISRVSVGGSDPFEEVDLARFRCAGCEYPTIEVVGRGSIPSMGPGNKGARVPLSALRADLEDGSVLVGRTLPWMMDYRNGTQRRRYRLMQAHQQVVPGARARRVAVLVHGIEGGFVRSVSMGPYRVELLHSSHTCEAGAGTAWMVFEKLRGAVFPSTAFRRSELMHVLECIALGFGQPVAWHVIAALGGNDEVVRAHYRHPSSHWKCGMRGWLADGNLESVQLALDFAARALPGWKANELRFGMGTAAEYAVRASRAAYLSWQARDLVIAVERLAKSHSGGKKGALAPQLKALELQVGLGASVSDDERHWFVQFRNRLSHEGDLRDPGASGVRIRKLYQSVGWLKTFALRHLLRAAGWDGPVLDFGRLPHKPRRITSKRFCRPKHVP